MSKEQLNRMKNDPGFIAALDQSGGSTPKALAAYGVAEGAWANEDEMFDLVHQMRARIITAHAFNSDHILGAILFKKTMESQVEGNDTADYLWQKKGIVPFLKVDNGLADEADGAQLMKPMPELNELLASAVEKHVFGTKMRSVIKEDNQAGIDAVVGQQFEVAKQICAAGLVPIIEPEVDIHAADKSAIEAKLNQALQSGLDTLTPDQLVMFKLTLPEEDNLYTELIAHPNVVRVVALSGGYSRDEANQRLSRQNGMVASFSRALVQDLRADQTDEEFDGHLEEAVISIAEASNS